MAQMVDGVVHVSFTGGGVFLPARTAEDRERIRATVRDQMRVVDRVQVLSGNDRWIVRRVPPTRPVECHACGVVTDSACFREGVTFCVACALTNPDQTFQRLEITGWDEA